MTKGRKGGGKPALALRYNVGADKHTTEQQAEHTSILQRRMASCLESWDRGVAGGVQRARLSEGKLQGLGPKNIRQNRRPRTPRGWSSAVVAVAWIPDRAP